MKLVNLCVFLITYHFFHHNQDLSPKQCSEINEGENNNCFCWVKRYKYTIPVKEQYSSLRQVEHVEHNGIIMQKYLQQNKTYITKEQSQFIFG